MREIASERYKDLTSPALLERRTRLVEARRELESIGRERRKLDKRSIRVAKRLKRIRGWMRWLVGSSEEELESEAREIMFERHYFEERVEKLKEESIYEFDDDAFEWHQSLAPHFRRLSRVQRVWDITHEKGETHYKSSATETIQRKPVKLFESSIPVVHPTLSSFCFGNSNGPDLHLFPGLIVLLNSGSPHNLALISFSDCRFDARDTRFQEVEGIPSDAEVIGHTWQYVNKDGGPDRRYSHNPQIPICRYGELTISSATGLNETFQFSDLTAMIAFVQGIQAQQEGPQPTTLPPDTPDRTPQPKPSPLHEQKTDHDELFMDAARVIVRSQQGSVSLLQRKLSVGYTRAARIVDQLEEAGIVGPFEGSKARDVLVEDEQGLDLLLNGEPEEEDSRR